MSVSVLDEKEMLFHCLSHQIVRDKCADLLDSAPALKSNVYKKS
jgi:hypothetical protein